LSVKFVETPQLSPLRSAELVPATIMHWSKAPVYGYLPAHNVRAHSVTLVEQTAWLFGGCDERECWGNMYAFDIGSCLLIVVILSYMHHPLIVNLSLSLSSHART
jgi:hypothetical protein